MIQTVFKHIISYFLVVTLITSSFLQCAQADVMSPITVSASIVPFQPLLIKGLMIDQADPFRFEFLMNSGDTQLDAQSFQNESYKMIRYFLASLATPEDQMWVNLSPVEKDRIIPDAFGKTDMGRDLLVQDYFLKQLTASLMNPEGETGKKFWEKVYEKLYASGIGHLASDQESPNANDQMLNAIESFNKVWIVPQTGYFYEHDNTVFIVDAKLKVMLESDYLASGILHSASGEQQPNANDQMLDARQIIRDVIIPIIEDEVNNGETFANLRQIYNSMLLSLWFKKRLKEHLLGQMYVNHQKTDQEVAHQDIEGIWQKYVEAFKSGAADVIKEEYDPQTQTVVPRKYFTGGAVAVNNAQLIDAQAIMNAGLPDRRVVWRADAAMMGGVRQKKRNDYYEWLKKNKGTKDSPSYVQLTLEDIKNMYPLLSQGVIEYDLNYYNIVPSLQEMAIKEVNSTSEEQFQFPEDLVLTREKTDLGFIAKNRSSFDVIYQYVPRGDLLSILKALMKFHLKDQNEYLMFFKKLHSMYRIDARSGCLREILNLAIFLKGSVFFRKDINLGFQTYGKLEKYFSDHREQEILRTSYRFAQRYRLGSYASIEFFAEKYDVTFELPSSLDDWLEKLQSANHPNKLPYTLKEIKRLFPDRHRLKTRWSEADRSDELRWRSSWDGNVYAKFYTDTREEKIEKKGFRFSESPTHQHALRQILISLSEYEFDTETSMTDILGSNYEKRIRSLRGESLATLLEYDDTESMIRDLKNYLNRANNEYLADDDLKRMEFFSTMLSYKNNGIDPVKRLELLRNHYVNIDLVRQRTSLELSRMYQLSIDKVVDALDGRGLTPTKFNKELDQWAAQHPFYKIGYQDGRSLVEKYEIKSKYRDVFNRLATYWGIVIVQEEGSFLTDADLEIKNDTAIKGNEDFAMMALVHVMLNKQDWHQGGINLRSDQADIRIQASENGFKLPEIDPAMLQQPLEHLKPVILDIRPMSKAEAIRLLGLQQEIPQDDSKANDSFSQERSVIIRKDV